MKTAISIPDALFKSADRLARRLRISRSQLYANAVQEYVKVYEHESLTRRVNEAIKGTETHLLAGARRVQAKAIILLAGTDRW